MEHFWEIFWTVVGIICTGIATAITKKISDSINSKIEDKKYKNALSAINDIIYTCVLSVTQVFVSTMKKSGKWTTDTAKEALADCKKKIYGQLTASQIKFIQDNFGDVDKFIVSKIESFIWKSKEDKSVEATPKTLFD